MMTKKVVGAGLGAAIAACQMAGVAWSQGITPPKVYTMTPGGVSLADGSFTFTEIDLVVGDLQLERFHLGGRRDPNDPFFGPRMSHNFDIYVAPNHKTRCDEMACMTFMKPIVHMGTSASGTYVETMAPNYSMTVGNLDASSGTLTHTPGNPYVYTDADGNVYTFSTSVAARGTTSSSRRVQNIVFANGRRRDFAYNSDGDLKTVVDSTGYAIVFDYAAVGRVSAACGYNLAQTYVTVASSCTGATLKVQYGYSAEATPKLVSVTNVTGDVTSYTYDRNEIACVKPPGFASCKISNVYGDSTDPWQVTEQTLAGTETWRFQFLGNYSSSRDPEAYALDEPWTQVHVTDPAGKLSIYTFVQTSPYSHTDPNGNTTSYRFRGGWDFQSPSDLSQNYGSSLVEATLPEGNKFLAEYAGPRRQVTKETLVGKPGSGLPDLVEEYGYPLDCTTAPNTPQNCAKPVWRKDARLNQTDYTYASNGLLLTEMQPAPSAGAARPLKVFTYVLKHAWVRSSGGGLTPAASAIRVPQSETVCQTAAGSNTPVCDGAAVQTVVTYEYGPDGTVNNLRVRGKVVTADGVSLRTCYGYDWRGNKIRETSPRAGLAVCQ